MRRRSQILTAALVSAILCVAASGQNTITKNSAGKVRLGMTVAEARKAVAPMRLSRTSDGEGIALIAVKSGAKTMMTLYAGEENRDAKINEKARIEQIEVWDPRYKTVKGLAPGMTVAKAETLYGKIKEIMLSEIESREYAAFANQPAGIDLRLINANDTAGNYPSGSNVTKKYRAGTKIFSILVHGRDNSITNGGSSGVEFTSSFTDLTKGCKSTGGEEGGHVSTFCKGPDGFIIHYFDAATIYQIDVATADRKWEEPVLTIGLDKLASVGRVEWRLADGKPFAVLVTVPGTGGAVARGLPGFERIKLNENGNGAADRLRSMIEAEYTDIVVPAVRVYPNGGSQTLTLNGSLATVADKLKYVFKAKTGQHLKVSINAKKWTGDEGPIMVGIVTMPDGETDGGPGGTVFDDVLDQTGDYEVLVYQNGAKSQTLNVELSISVTLTGQKGQMAEDLDAIVAKYLPAGTKLVSPAVKGTFGGSVNNIVALYGEEGPTMSYSAMVLTPSSDGFSKYELPLPEFTWSMEEPKEVFFANADNDKELELFIIGECYTGIGPTGAQPFYRTRVYDRSSRGFAHMEVVSEKIGTLKTAAAIRSRLPAM